MNRLELYIDGAAKGNPGPAGVGVVICQEDFVVKNISQYIGQATNNIAEYTALIYALQEALILGAREIKINTDSELLYKQVKGEYRVKHPNIKPLFEQIKHLFLGFSQVEIFHIRRKDNRGADKLANKAIRSANKVLPC